MDLFDKMSKNFKENYLKYSKVGYFDDKFEELEMDKICQKIGIDKRDLDEIIKKTKFEVEGAVAYLKNGKRIFKKGEHNKVAFTKNELIMMEKNIHSHPSGISFSFRDIELMFLFQIRHLVVFNGEYLYSLKLDGFDIRYLQKIKTSIDDIEERLQKLVQRGIITKSQKDFSINHKLWKEVFSKDSYEYFKIKKN